MGPTFDLNRTMLSMFVASVPEHLVPVNVSVRDVVMLPGAIAAFAVVAIAALALLA